MSAIAQHLTTLETTLDALTEAIGVAGAPGTVALDFCRSLSQQWLLGHCRLRNAEVDRLQAVLALADATEGK